MINQLLAQAKDKRIGVSGKISCCWTAIGKTTCSFPKIENWPDNKLTVLPSFFWNAEYFITADLHGQSAFSVLVLINAVASTGSLVASTMMFWKVKQPSTRLSIFIFCCDCEWAEKHKRMIAKASNLDVAISYSCERGPVVYKVIQETAILIQCYSRELIVLSLTKQYRYWQ